MILSMMSLTSSWQYSGILSSHGVRAWGEGGGEGGGDGGGGDGEGGSGGDGGGGDGGDSGAGLLAGSEATAGGEATPGRETAAVRSENIESRSTSECDDGGGDDDDCNVAAPTHSSTQKRVTCADGGESPAAQSMR